MQRHTLAIFFVLSALAATATQAASPSYDCANARSIAEKLVCTDGQLARLDRETARLFALARDGSHMTPDRRKQLVAYQRGWIKGRDECWKANDQRICVRDNYAIRIFELRQGYADTRTKDDKGISTGPLSLECRDFGAGIGIVFISTDPQIATLAWKDRKMALAGTPSGSGANYAGHSFDGSYTLSTKGKEATFDTPDGRRYSCMIATGG